MEECSKDSINPMKGVLSAKIATALNVMQNSTTIPCMEKIPMHGGRSTKGVFRQGGILYRPHKKESGFANSVLAFLEKQNFPYSQRYLGRADDGTDMFSFIDGFVPDEIGETTIEQLCAFMKIVRQMHDVSADFAPEGKVVCHNDLSPCNTVFQNGVPVAIIDWDSATFGERWEDLTYILWLWINIGSHERHKIDIKNQMKSALKAYQANEETLRGLIVSNLVRKFDSEKSHISIMLR